MRKKVFASDFDGTLYFYKAAVKLPPENVAMIKEYQAAGNLFGLCTGRQIGGLTPFIGGLVAPDFFITSSGANIVDGQLNPIFRRGVDRGAADALVRRYRDTRRMTLDVEGEICVFAPMDYPGSYHVVTGVDDAPEGMIHQVSIHCETLEDAAATAAWINAALGGYVTAFQNVVEVDVAPRGCSKGEGVRRLREWMRKKWGDVTLYGIGDSNNDLPLLEASDVSYTFPYAPPELQKQADRVVPTIVDALRDSLEQKNR